jgi:PhnB protein
MLAWLRTGTGVIMVGRADEEVHQISSPRTGGKTTVQVMVKVDDIDSHYAHAVANRADISMPIEDAFYGERRYEATDLEGHRWHFAESFEHIRARGGALADDPAGGLPANDG